MELLIGYERGVNIGGWLSQGVFTKEHLENFITEKDITILKSWGLDHIRLPIDFENLLNEDNSPNEYGISLMIKCLEWCKKANLNVVVDLHKTKGYIFDDAEYSKGFWQNEELKQMFLDTWDMLAQRLIPYEDMIMVEMLNEVTSFDVVKEWNELGLKCIDVIRKYMKNVKILFGGVGYSAVIAVKWLPDVKDENVIYNIHCYEPLIFTHQGAYWVDEMPHDFRIEYPGDFDYYMKKTYEIKGCTGGSLNDKTLPIKSLGPDFFEVLFKDAIETCQARGKKLYCGEYGAIGLADPQSMINWYKDINTVFRKYNIGRCAWTYKALDFDLQGDQYKEILPELSKYF